MSKEKNKDTVIQHKITAVNEINSLIDEFIKDDLMKADKFSYWLEDYSKFLKYEKEFNAKKLKRYKRGEIIKAHLGFNVGSEEGGLHYCMVLDKENNLSSPVVTVIPLTSLKSKNKIKSLRKGELYIGNDLFNTLETKAKLLLSSTGEELINLTQRAHNSNTIEKSELLEVQQRLNSIKNIQDELNKMKTGSIALIGQITTISKIRIYTPKTKYDVLSNVRLPSNTLDLIDTEIQNLFIGKK